MKISELNNIDPSSPLPEERMASKMYLCFSLILGLTGWFGFSVQPTIYHGAATIWHSIGMLTDISTCALPLFNWALAFGSAGNLSLFVFTSFRPWVLGQKTFYVASLFTIIIMSGYIMNLLMAFYMTTTIFPR